MKKKYLLNLLTVIMVAILSVGFVSCGSDDDDSSPTTYTLKWNFEILGIDDVMLFEYSDSGDKIANHSVDKVEKNGSYLFTASEKATKIKVYFKMGSSPRWVQQVYYLKIGSNVDIEVNDHTIIGRSEP